MTDSAHRHYCTLFDRNYFLKGLALYRSLQRHGGDFTLHILCMDDYVHELFTRSSAPDVELIRRTDFEAPELLAVKPGRSAAEYCWTCTSSLISYVLRKRPDVDLITYLDADLYFFASPQPVYDELADGSVLIIEHRFSPALRHLVENGRFNVGWVSFRRDAHGLAALEWWRARCIEWCFARVEDGRMGDQKYLDSFPVLFGGVVELQHKGANVGPWNFAGYDIEGRDGQIYVDDAPLIFYHFHNFKARIDGTFEPLGAAYLTEKPLPRLIYDPYQQATLEALAEAQLLDAGFAYGLEPLAAAAMPPVTNCPSAGVAGSRLPAVLTSLASTPLPQPLQRLVRLLALLLR